MEWAELQQMLCCLAAGTSGPLLCREDEETEVKVVVVQVMVEGPESEQLPDSEHRYLSLNTVT